MYQHNDLLPRGSCRVVGNVARGSRDCTGTTTCGSPGGEGGVQIAVCR